MKGAFNEYNARAEHAPRCGDHRPVSQAAAIPETARTWPGSNLTPAHASLLRRNRLLGSLDPRDLDRLRDDFRIFRLRPGVILHQPNEPIERVWFPLSGMIALMVLMTDGRSMQSLAVGAEGAVGILPTYDGSSACRAVVEISGSAACISASEFQAVLRQSEKLREVVWRYAGTLLSHLQRASACNSLHPLEGRFARWLLEANDRSSEGTLDLTQQELAHCLGVRRTTITLLARMFQVQGMIKYRRGHIVIHDRPSLEKSACECYRIMRRLAGSPPTAAGDASVG